MAKTSIWSCSLKKNIRSFFKHFTAFNTHQINLLRKTGQLDLALMQAQTLYQNHGQFVTLAWVYYDLWKAALEKADWAAIEDIRKKVFLMHITDEALLKTQFYWLVVKTGYKALKAGVSEGYVQTQLEGLTTQKPIFEPVLSLALLQLAAKTRVNWNGYLNFNQWAQIELITEPQMLERLIIPIAKTLLQMPMQQNETALYQYFFDWIKKTSLSQKDLFYVNYYFVKLLLRAQLLEEAKTHTLTLIKVKPREFWVWQLLANCLVESPDLRYAAYCKALSCGGKAAMLIGLRQEFAGFLIELHKWNQAKHEMACIEQVRLQNNWNIPDIMHIWSKYPDIQRASAEQTDYTTQSIAIDYLLWDKAHTLSIVITQINAEDQTAYYWTEKQNGGKVNLKKIKTIKLELGATYDAMYKKHAMGYDQIVELRKSDEVATWCKSFEGGLRVLPSGIGFCGEIFVNKSNIEKIEAKSNDLVRGFACLTHDPKKQKMGWRAIKIGKDMEYED